jgi:hypothetical protein
MTALSKKGYIPKDMSVPGVRELILRVESIERQANTYSSHLLEDRAVKNEVTDTDI